jgi:hypothetical protein
MCFGRFFLQTYLVTLATKKRFINCFVLAFSVLLEVASYRLPGRNSLYFYVCSGKNPLRDQDVPIKNPYFSTTLILFTFLCHVTVILKIRIYKRKILPHDVGQGSILQKSISYKS